MKENKNESKLVKFLKSFIIPRYMLGRVKTPFYVSLVLLIVASLFNVATSNITAKNDAANYLNQPEIFEHIPENLNLTNIENGNSFPVLMLETKNITDGLVDTQSGTHSYTYNGLACTSSENGVFSGNFEYEGKKAEVTVVVETDTFTSFGSTTDGVGLKSFNIDSYTSRVKEDDTSYLLMVFTLDYFFCLYNLEQKEDGISSKEDFKNQVYELEDGDYVYYLPANETELVKVGGLYDTNLWTRKVSSTDTIDFSYAENIKPVKKHLYNVQNALYGLSCHYKNLTDEGLNGSDLNSNFSHIYSSLFKSMVSIKEDTLKTQSLLISFVLNLIFPLIISLITWLLIKSMYLKKFKNYYCIAAISFFDVSIIAVFLGIFISYLKTSIFILAAGAILFMFFSFRVNVVGLNKKEEEKEVVDPVKTEETKDISDTTRIG